MQEMTTSSSASKSGNDVKESIRLILTALALTTSSICNANGGPVEWTKGKPVGGIVPRQENAIELVREDLEITVNDFNTYTVEANYLLSNPDAARRVKYGVPLYWVEKFNPKEAAADIRISVEGKEYGCTAVDPTQRKPDANNEMIGTTGDAWCVTEIEIPKGLSVKLKLQYQGELEFVDWEYSKSARREFSSRTLKYPLKPAGYWKGNPDLQVRINPGPYTGRIAKYSPVGAVNTGDVITWKLPKANLKQLMELHVEFTSTPLLQHQELAAWNTTANLAQRLTGQLQASSTLTGSSYGVKNLMDGNPATAWCEGKQGNGNGESFTIRFDAQKDEYPCRTEGIAVIPGYTKSAETYLNNGRISKLRIEDCDDPSSFAVVGWKPNDAYNLSAIFMQTQHDSFVPGDHVEKTSGRWIPKGYELPNYQQPSCLRFTILETVPGKLYSDTCISELAFVRNCG